MKRIGSSLFQRSLSGIGSWASVLVVVFCPACWPVLAAALGSAGLSAFASQAVLKPLLIAFLVLAVAGLGRGYRVHRKPWPFVMGIAGAGGLYAGKWVLFNLPLLYAGAAFLIVSSLADRWLSRPRHGCCPTHPASTVEPSFAASK